MDRIATKARLLQRTLFASLPFSHRMAVFCLRVASDPTLFGRIMYAEFMRAGVQGLEVPEIEINRVSTDYRKVPPMIGKEFGKIVYLRLYKLVSGDHDEKEQAALDLMTNFMVRVMDPADQKAKCRPGMEAKQAFAWVHTILRNYAFNMARDQGRDQDALGKSVPIPTHETDSGPQEVEFADPLVIQHLIKDMPRSEWQRLELDLLSVIPAKEKPILSLKLDGWTNEEVADELQLSGAWVGAVLKKYKPQLTRVIQEYLA